MNRIAIIGNIGGGKTTSARRLPEALSLPLYELDQVLYSPWLRDTPRDEIMRRFRLILDTDQWIVEGVSETATLEMIMEAADTVVMIDLPLLSHYWRTACRRIKAIVTRKPSELPVLRGWRPALGQLVTIWRRHRQQVPQLRGALKSVGGGAAVYHLRSGKQLNSFTKRFG
ncbi:MAG: hypothetical protein ACE363_13105 [Alphaproteobacteria bacterium]